MKCYENGNKVLMRNNRLVEYREHSKLNPRDPNDRNDPNGNGPYWQYRYSGGWRYPLEIHRDRITDAWEFRFDSGRERYFARHFNTTIDPNSDPNDPNSLLPEY